MGKRLKTRKEWGYDRKKPINKRQSDVQLPQAGKAEARG